MSYDDCFYTDEPIGYTPKDSASDKRDAKWDYVEDVGKQRRMSWLDDYKLNNEDEAPEDIKLLLAMIRKDYWSITNNKSFYEQALFMAGYEDDAPVVPFSTYFPTYRQMSVAQLRSYFTIRKLLRQGKHPDVSLSYLFVYAYETLMQIGVTTPEEGYDILCDLRDHYPDMNPKKRPYLTEWISDYVVWYGLSNHYGECFKLEQQKGKAMYTLDHYATASDEELFNVIDDLSRHSISKGALYKKRKEAAISATATTVRALIPVIEKHYSNAFSTLCLGRQNTTQHIMFDTAVFYTPNPIREAAINVTNYHRYVCHKGLWRKTIDVGKASFTPTMLRQVLHDIDASVRKCLGVKPAIATLQIRPSSCIHEAMTQAIAKWFLQWKAKEKDLEQEAKHKAIEKARQGVSLDLSKLRRIREDADVVRDALIVDDEAPIQQPQLPTQKSAENTPSPIKESKADAPEVFINLLLSGGDYNAYLRSIHTPAGLMVEEINNKAMDVIGDIVLEDDGESISIIDDYREDIKHLYD